MPRAAVVGIGSCLPARSVDNQQVITEGRLDSSDEWIRRRTGIHRRRRAAPGTATGDLAVYAAAAAIESADAAPDFVLLATTTPDHPCPATAPAVAHRLGLPRVPALDLSAVCSGFLYALTTADALVRAGACRHPLVIGADTYSTIVDPTDRDTAALFGDGAGAVLLAAAEDGAPGALHAADLGSDGGGAALITIDAGGSRHPDRQRQDPDGHWFRMRGRSVYGQAVRHLTDSAARALAAAGWKPADLGAFVAHQANQRILDSVADRLGLPPAVRFGNLRELGNTAAASIPLVLADDGPQRALAPGTPTLLTAFGGGLTWASIALTWPAATPVRRTLD
ncbi:beta-ketoacyl-ACP synthase 3 [Kitasatospora sp. YST-16]|uniref:beta-ketoacyl-ACP synthase 3 n=1 Tax=Kitasatospora sp. YST-16 TaxID=2998080 RepID=UPI00228487A8|nr:beta-ketoacyl-ACP synthase 3 [Kitasatospora sp. YST-16]WAL76082.1 beta-ketoacyl-ACP synthase 3 [Kitasatospora sp. YST-16]WNW42136.1 beta-ketoacyl-ACP synthase 3 [Streptomyces sp. Li-HN-5-13]